MITAEELRNSSLSQEQKSEIRITAALDYINRSMICKVTDPYNDETYVKHGYYEKDFAYKLIKELQNKGYKVEQEVNVEDINLIRLTISW